MLDIISSFKKLDPENVIVFKVTDRYASNNIPATARTLATMPGIVAVKDASRGDKSNTDIAIHRRYIIKSKITSISKEVWNSKDAGQQKQKEGIPPRKAGVQKLQVQQQTCQQRRDVKSQLNKRPQGCQSHFVNYYIVRT
jgi:hypothetical protein